MPELPEVETICRQLTSEIVGRQILAVNILEPKVVKLPKNKFIKAVTGVKILKVSRRAKLILMELSSGETLFTHLKMTGQYVCHGELHKHTRIVFELSGGRKLLFNDLRLFGYLKLMPTKEVLNFLATQYGPEPLEDDFTLDKFAAILIKRKKAKIKPLLLDQKMIAGIGNIYAMEACYLAGVNPRRLAGSLKPAEVKKLYSKIREVMNEAIRYGGTTSENYVNAYGEKGNFVTRLKVYGRAGEPCLKCHQPLIGVKLGGRGTVYCEQCQK